MIWEVLALGYLLNHRFLTVLKWSLTNKYGKERVGLKKIELNSVSKYSTRICVPSLRRTLSPFQTNRESSSLTKFSEQLKNVPKETVDYRWTIIENFKGYSETKKIDHAIPCVFLRNTQKTTKILIYFHGNSEDLGTTLVFLKMIQKRFDAHVIAVEYPGYGVYQGKVNEVNVLNDANRVLNFVQKVLKWSLADVIVMGRSIGTGPAWYLASMHSLWSLILISPYTSIRGIAKSMFGSFSQYMIKERFKNFENIAKVKWPTFILHGEMDTIIPAEHSKTLSSLCNGPTWLVISSTMTHNSFKFAEEFMDPLLEFYQEQCITTLPPETIEPKKTEKENTSCCMFSRPYFSYLKTPQEVLKETKENLKLPKPLTQQNI